ncbi:hypothetical protein ACIBHY_23275 [Nonomuraea sp. NPDC050547]
MDIRPRAPHLPLNACGHGRATGNVAVPDTCNNTREAVCRKDTERK